MEEPIVIWLSGLHIPESYLIAHIQIACRLYTWPLDRSTQFTRVTGWTCPDEIEERPVCVSIITIPVSLNLSDSHSSLSERAATIQVFLYFYSLIDRHLTAISPGGK